MKKLQNVLYVTTPHSSLSVKNKSICVSNSENSVTVPVHNIETVICFGDMTVTTPFMKFCSDNKVKLVFLSEYGKYYGAFNGAQNGSVFLRTEQYRMFSDEDIKLRTTFKIIEAKITNSMRVLSRTEDRCSEFAETLKMLLEMRNMLENASDIDEIRGIEGYAAKCYFSAFDYMIKTDDEHMKFEKRTQRPPENNVNALLSFVYTLLRTDITAAVESTGLDIQVGVMHSMNYGKPSLVLDMMEELRAPLCDRFVVSLINRKQINSDDFTTKDGEIILSDKGRKTVIQAWQKRKQDEIMHTVINEKIVVGLIPFVQASIMSAYIRRERNDYEPFLWK